MTEPDVRFLLANERTYLAWQRSAVGLLAAALAVFHLMEPTPVLRGLGAVLLVAAVLATGGGWWRYVQADRAIRAGRTLDARRGPEIFVVLLLVGVVLAGLSVLG